MTNYEIRMRNRMKKIVLISCVSQKLHNKAKAQDLYISTLFKLNLQFAKKIKPDKTFILSAKYGLLGLDDEIEPYNLTLNNMSAKDRKFWADGVIKQLRSETDLKNDHFVILAGDRYRKYLISELVLYEIPLKGLPIGKQLQYLKRHLNDD